MQLMRGNHRRLGVAFSVIFAMQLLASSLCIVTPAQATEAVSNGHCHQSMHSMNMGHTAKAMHPSLPRKHDTACTHCDSPQNLNTTVQAADLVPAAMLLAVVVPLAEIASPAAVHTSGFADRAQAPPDSSDTLFTTTQRIRI